MTLDTQKYRALFVEEGREHLAELSRLLVELETSGEPQKLIDEAFRHAHSVKGMAASMGYDPITTLAHRMEDVVETQRQRGEAFPKQVVDKLLRTVDALVSQVEAIAAEKPLPQHVELVHELAALLHEQSGAPAKVTARDVVALTSPAAGDVKVICVRISEASATPAVRAFLAHRRISELTPVLSANPTLEQLKAGHLPGREVRFSVPALADEAAIRRVITGMSDIEAVTVEEGPRAASVGEIKPPNRPAPDGESPKGAATVRVRTDVLDALIDSVGELFIARERLSSLLADTSRPEVRAALDALSAHIRQIHDQVMAVRMMPLRTLTDRYPRLVRDLGRTLEKEVELEVSGGEIELDRAILDHLDAVFVHTLRNAVDHGLEAASVRIGHGKPSLGKVRISASRDRDTVVVVIEDDGRGLDPAALRQAAINKNLITARDAATMTARDSYFLICLPGFSTKTEVSDVSGRGVGMDAVRAKVESFGGTLDIDSELGRGTRFMLRLPLTVAIVPALLVEVSQGIFAVPVAKVVSVREKGEDLIRQAGGHVYLSFRHALVPVVELSDLLHLPEAGRTEQVVVIEDGRDLSAVAVARIVGYHEVVVKPLGEPLDRLEWFSGAAIMGDGQPILILDLPRALRQRMLAA